MKQVILFLFIAMTVATAYGKTLRVNNTTGSGAPYTTVDEALAAASEGDVIILEASPNSYGDITVSKTVTIQGEGYFRDINGISQEGAAATEVGKIIVKNAEGAKISSLYAGMITLNSNRTIVTRCYGSLPHNHEVVNMRAVARATRADAQKRVITNSQF